MPLEFIEGGRSEAEILKIMREMRRAIFVARVMLVAIAPLAWLRLPWATYKQMCYLDTRDERRYALREFGGLLYRVRKYGTTMVLHKLQLEPPADGYDGFLADEDLYEF